MSEASLSSVTWIFPFYLELSAICFSIPVYHTNFCPNLAGETRICRILMERKSNCMLFLLFVLPVLRNSFHCAEGDQ